MNATYHTVGKLLWKQLMVEYKVNTITLDIPFRFTVPFVLNADAPWLQNRLRKVINKQLTRYNLPICNVNGDHFIHTLRVTHNCHSLIGNVEWVKYTLYIEDPEIRKQYIQTLGGSDPKYKV